MHQIANVLTELEMEAVADVREFVVKAHSGQLRRGGVEPYHQHAWRVGEAVQARSGMSLHAILAAYLHDTIEDTGVSAMSLLELGHSTRTVNLVLDLSRLDGVPYDTYIQCIIDSGDVELMTIKLADVNDNSIMWPEGVWENWESSMLRYTKTKIKLVNALNKLLTKP